VRKILGIDYSGGWLRKSVHFDDHLDLDAGAQRNLRHAEGRARMAAGLAEHFPEQVRAAIGDQVMFSKISGGIDQAGDFDDAFDAI